jgi:hypothetical protein
VGIPIFLAYENFGVLNGQLYGFFRLWSLKEFFIAEMATSVVEESKFLCKVCFELNKRSV